MLNKVRQFDKGFLVVIAICLIAIWPFISRASLPNDTDAELHILRLAELARMWQGGVVYPRWAANFYFGYGYPIFNYYAPLSYYAGLLFLALPGFGPVLATKAVFVLGLLGAGIGMYGFVRDNWGRGSGLVAATSYVYAPYILYIDPHARGVLAESFSFAVLPCALWALDRLRKRPSWRNFVASVLCLAGIVTAHNLMAMVFGALTFGWFVWVAVTKLKRDKQPVYFGLAAFGLGVLLAAFFWMPMVLEQDAIQINSVVEEGSHYDFKQHFLTLGEIFGRNPPLDWRATDPEYDFHFGVPQWLLGFAGMVIVLLPGTKGRWHGLFWIVCWIILTYMLLPLSTAVWQVIPLLRFMQFPWRLLAGCAAALAVLAGIGVSRASEGDTRLGKILVTLAVVVLIGGSLRLTQPQPWGDFGDTDVMAVFASETQGRWLGTTSTADFVPVTVDAPPRPKFELIELYRDSDTPDKLSRASFKNTVVETEIISPIHTKYIVESERPAVLRLFIFDFPGWQATLDGEPVEITLAQPEGWITIPVPEGSHEVELEFGTTAPRRNGWLLSGGALVITLGIAFVLSRKDELGESHPPKKHEPILRPVMLGLGFVWLLFFAWLEPTGVLHVVSADTIAEPASEQVTVSFNDKIALIGYDAPQTTVAGEQIDLTLYWQALQPLEDNHAVFVHFLDVRGQIKVVAQSDKLNPGDFPTENWPVDKYVRDAHSFVVPSELPPGKYQLTVGLIGEDERRLSVIGPSDEWFVLREIMIEP